MPLEQLAAAISRIVVVRDGLVQLLLAGLLCEGSILLEDAPGTGKTLLAKTVARLVGGSFKRIQCTPDLLPADITGGNLYNQKTGDFQFLPGPVFANVVLVDEINRATPRTQAGLFEVMAEAQVTVDGETRVLPRPHFMVATQNPAESAGTYPLPEGQLDRFLFTLHVGYPTRDQERLILERGRAADPLAGVEPIMGVDTLQAHIDAVREIHVSAGVREYMVELVARTREHPAILHGVSPRGGVALQHAAQAVAYLKGHDYVSPDEVQEVAGPVLLHRLVVRSGERSAVLQALLAEIPLSLGTR